jgi:hypothetical protein
MMFDVYNELDSSSKYTHDFPNLLDTSLWILYYQNIERQVYEPSYISAISISCKPEHFCPKYSVSFAGTPDPDHHVICINVCG